MSYSSRLALLFTFATIACQQQTDPNTTLLSAANVVTDSAAAAISPAVRLSPIMSGYWLSTDYLDEVARTRSPAAAFNHTPPGPASLYIEPFANRLDSVAISASYGMHEGGDFTILLHSQPNTHSVMLKLPYESQFSADQRLSYRITKTDTTLLYTGQSVENKTMRVPYKRVLPFGFKTDLNGGIDWTINKLLVEGSYRGTDSLQQPVQAVFSANGSVKGLPFRKYAVKNDFTGPNGGDELIFDLHTTSQLELAATFGRDTLRLYSMHTTLEALPGQIDTIEVYRRSRLRYELIRQK